MTHFLSPSYDRRSSISWFLNGGGTTPGGRSHNLAGNVIPFLGGGDFKLSLFLFFWGEKTGYLK